MDEIRMKRDEIRMKRELMEVLRSAIPAMEAIELNTLAVTVNRILEHMDERGAVKHDEE